MEAQIALEGMDFYAYHGCFEEEQLIGTHFKVDVYMEVDVKNAPLDDDLSQTISYLDVYQLVKKEVEIKSKLLEHVANRTIDVLLANFPQLRAVTVKVAKLNPPLGGKLTAASVSLTKQQK